MHEEVRAMRRILITILDWNTTSLNVEMMWAIDRLRTAESYCGGVLVRHFSTQNTWPCACVLLKMLVS